MTDAAVSAPRTVSALARAHGLSRATLLYYDRIGLLRPSARSQAGYRLYSENDAERLGRICRYRAVGLTLDEIAGLLDAPARADQVLLRDRLGAIGEEIAALELQGRVIQGLLGQMHADRPLAGLTKDTWVGILRGCGMSDEDMGRWHQRFERDAPQAHEAFLRWLGIPAAEIRRIRSRSVEAGQDDPYGR